ncbi:hypothetical protein NYY81_18975, partial [Acinetobacter baumannii]|nr:hypothetical protein [Acinetobacter baumannii]
PRSTKPSVAGATAFVWWTRPARSAKGRNAPLRCARSSPTPMHYRPGARHTGHHARWSVALGQRSARQ